MTANQHHDPAAIDRARWEANFSSQQLSRIRNNIAKFTHNPSDVDDLLQESLLIAIEKGRQGKINEPDKVPAFATGVAYNVLRNTIRRRSREVPLCLEIARTEEEPATDLLPALTALIGKLPIQRDRDVMSMYMLSGLPPEHIARCHSITKRNVYGVVNRAKSRLIDIVQQNAGSSPATKGAHATRPTATGDQENG